MFKHEVEFGSEANTGSGEGAYPFSNCQKGVGLYSSKKGSGLPPFL